MLVAFSVDVVRWLFQFRDMKKHGTYAAVLAILMAVVLSLGSARAQTTDDKYLRIYHLIDQGDVLSQRGQVDPAKAKYQEAEKALLNFKKSNPTWNNKVVSYRLDYLAKRIEALSQPVTPSDATSAGQPGAKPALKGALPANTQMKLLDPGAEPRQLLRLRATAGEKQTAAMTVKMAMGMGVAGAKPEMMKLPGMKFSVGVLPTSVSTEGDINYDLIIEDISLADEPGSTPEMVEAMKASLGGVKGLAMAFTVADRGFNKKTEVKIPPGTGAETRKAMEEMKESFSNTEFLLPLEEVGVGARWEVKQKIKSEGMTIDQTTIHTLVSIEGGVITTKSAILQQAANQKIPNPMMPTTKADLVKLAGSGSATMTIDLGKILPIQATVADLTETTLSVDAGGQKQTMVMKSDLTLRLESQ